MPGTDRFNVKCEPPSDDEDINSQYVSTCLLSEVRSLMFIYNMNMF